MTPVHRADCEDCSWSYQGEDIVDVSDEMEDHARKEQHDVDFDRAVVTDGGEDVPRLIDWSYEAVVHGADVDASCLALTADGTPCSYNAYDSNDLPVCNTHADVDDPDVVVTAHQWARISERGGDTITVCVNCHDVWKGNEPETAIECPECGVSPGSRCERQSSGAGVSAPIPPHPMRRKQAYGVVDEFVRCPANPAGSGGQVQLVTDGGSSDLGNLHAATALEVDGQAVLAIKGTDGSAQFAVPEGMVAPLEDTVDEVGRVYTGETDGTLIGDGGRSSLRERLGLGDDRHVCEGCGREFDGVEELAKHDCDKDAVGDRGYGDGRWGVVD